MYTVKGLKSFQGMDGLAYSATICRDGKRVGTVMNEGCGGETNFDWFNDAEEKAAKDFVAALPHEMNEFTQKMEPQDMDCYFAALCDKYEEVQRLKRAMRAKTFFRLKDETYKDGEWRTVKKPYSPEVQKYLDEKYGNRVSEILNLKDKVEA
jgi:hypothetical protein